MGRKRTKTALAVLAVTAAACSGGAELPVAKISPKSPVASVPSAPPRPVDGPADAREPTYYRAVDAPVHASVRSAELPLNDAQIARLENADAKWAAAPEALRDRVRKLGFAVLAGDGKQTRLGQYYTSLRDARVPYVITMDVMVQLAHLALDRLFAEAEQRSLAPAMNSALARIEARLEGEGKKATSDLIAPYALARGVIAVARALADPRYAPPADVAQPAAVEVRRVVAHAGPAPSALLGTQIDYAQLAPRGALSKSDPELAAYRALDWLASAPLSFASRTEAAGAQLDVAQARDQTRAALLLARLVDPEVDTAAAGAWARVARPLALLAGPPDDPSPRALVARAQRAGLDARDGSSIENVARLDRARRAFIDGPSPRVYDGAGGITFQRGVDPTFWRASTGMRMFGPAATPDGKTLQALVQPAVAGRTIPSGLDIAAWLGSSEALALAREAAESPYAATFGEQLEGVTLRRVIDESRHGSVLASGLTSIETYLASTLADGALPASSTTAWQRHKIEVALGAWTTLRHDAVAFARLHVRSPSAPTEVPVSRIAVPAFVEPHPEAIALLIAMVEQAARGLAALGAIDPPGPTSVAGAAMRLLRTCLAVALREANDEPIGPDESAALADLPTLLVDLEGRLAASRGADRPLVVDVHGDAASARVLEEALGAIDDMYLVVREPETGRLVLALGATFAHHELLQPAALRLTDTEWRARLLAAPPPRGAFTSAYVVSPGESR